MKRDDQISKDLLTTLVELFEVEIQLHKVSLIQLKFSGQILMTTCPLLIQILNFNFINYLYNRVCPFYISLCKNNLTKFTFDEY